jgi:hypothetical protein
MKLLLILSLLTVEPEDQCEIYLLDMMWATFSPRWESAYDSSLTAFRSVQGCLDLKRWYILYQAKLRCLFYPGFGLRYRYHRLEDYNDSLELHRVEPWFRIREGLNLHLMITPKFWKRGDEIGTGLSWFKSDLDHLDLFFIIKDFDNNFALQHTPPGPEREVYRDHRYPYKFTIEGAKRLSRLNLRIYLELITEAKKVLEDPEAPRTRYFSSQAGSARLEVQASEKIVLGGLGAYDHRGERVYTDSITTDTLTEFLIEPFIGYEWSKASKIQARYRYTHKRHNSYKRRWTGLDLMFYEELSPDIELGLGYQRGDRKITGAEDPYNIQNRAVISLELKFLGQARLWIVEGIELDGFPKETFRHPHNHTYVALFIPFS